jgi:hypothetical protein
MDLRVGSPIELTLCLHFLTRRSRNQKGHNIQKLETSSKSTQNFINSGDRAYVEKYSAKNLQNSNGQVLSRDTCGSLQHRTFTHDDLRPIVLFHT